MQITEYELRHYLGATGPELLTLRVLLEQDEDGHYEQSTAARTLLSLRQGAAARDGITEAYRSQQTEQPPAPAGLVARLRRLGHKRVPK